MHTPPRIAESAAHIHLARRQHCGLRKTRSRRHSMQEHVDAALVRGAWQRLLPGLLEHYDSQASLPCICPRPLFVVNGAHDARCPVAGLRAPLRAARRAYRAAGKCGNFGAYIDERAGHEVTEAMDCHVEEFFVRALRPQWWRRTARRLGCVRPRPWWRPWPRAGGCIPADAHESLRSVCDGPAPLPDALRNGASALGPLRTTKRPLRRPSHHAYQEGGNASVIPV